MDKNKVIESAAKLITKGQFEKAVKEYQRVLELDPDDVRVLQKLAELFQKMNRQSEAADCFEKVARTYGAQGFYLKAVALYKQVLKVVERVEVNVRLAELYQQLGLIGDATKEWQTVAAHYEKAGDTKASLDTLKKLVDLDPDNVAARIRLGEQYARQDDLIEAVAELRRAAQYLQKNGRHDDYLRVAERISHLDQNDVGLAKELAEQYLSRGDSKRALAKLQICFKANPRELGTLQMLARAFQELGQISKTVSVLKELARVHLDSARADDAQNVYRQAAELAPDDPEVKAALSRPEPVAARTPTPPPLRAPTPVASRPAMAPVPPGAPIATPPPGKPLEPAAPGSIPKLLKETEVYVKYGLHEKALDHLRRIFAAEPDNVEAHEKSKTLALATNRKDDAVAELVILLRLYLERGDARLAAVRDELSNLDPENAALAAVGGDLPEEAIELEADDAIEIIPEDDSAPGVELSLESAPGADIPPDESEEIEVSLDPGPDRAVAVPVPIEPEPAQPPMRAFEDSMPTPVAQAPVEMAPPPLDE